MEDNYNHHSVEYLFDFLRVFGEHNNSENIDSIRFYCHTKGIAGNKAKEFDE